VLPNGQSSKVDGDDRARSVHVVRTTSVGELEHADISPVMTNTKQWTSCCDVVFAPGTVELVAWGTQSPHEGCVRKSGYPQSFVKRMHHEACNVLRRASADDDMSESIAVLDSVLTKRGSDWARNKRGDEWLYEASFNGVFSNKRMFPRGVDIGLQPLHVELLYPGTVQINSCGVRDGCSLHAVRAETFSLTDIQAFNTRVSSHEVHATSIMLGKMIWCLLAGECGVIPLHADG
jgi:hypothetical protein